MDQHFQELLKYVGAAVAGNHNLEVQYKGLQRLVTPHMLGETHDGRLVLHCFQFGGMTSKGAIANPSQGGWRWLYLDEFENLASGWGPSYPLDLKKAEDQEYEPPDFVARVLVLR